MFSSIDGGIETALNGLAKVARSLPPDGDAHSIVSHRTNSQIRIEEPPHYPDIMVVLDVARSLIVSIEILNAAIQR